MASADTTSTQAIIFDGGDGVLAFVEQWRDIPPGHGGIYTAIYSAKAPQWKPRLLIDSSAMPIEFRVAGQTYDGARVYLMSYGPVDNSAGGPLDLWEINTKADTVRRVCRSPLLGGDLIPSPQGDLLAETGPGSVMGPARVGLTIIDSASGAIHDLTWRRRGDYVDSAVGWSRDVPRRLYFVDYFGNLWQLDINLDESEAVKP
jgi:hypothetical protein